jgi:hypothetical protein
MAWHGTHILTRVLTRHKVGTQAVLRGVLSECSTSTQTILGTRRVLKGGLKESWVLRGYSPIPGYVHGTHARTGSRRHLRGTSPPWAFTRYLGRFAHQRGRRTHGVLTPCHRVCLVCPKGSLKVLTWILALYSRGYSRGYSHCTDAVSHGSHMVKSLTWYSRGTHEVPRRYSRGTHGVLVGYSHSADVGTHTVLTWVLTRSSPDTQEAEYFGYSRGTHVVLLPCAHSCRTHAALTRYSRGAHAVLTRHSRA